MTSNLTLALLSALPILVNEIGVVYELGVLCVI